MVDLTDTLSPIFSTAAAKNGVTPFAYGWCNVITKNGKVIDRSRRDTDFLNDEPYASSVAAMLARLGLPKPKPEEIFRGGEHDLLFLNSHGVVVRIGPTDVVDLMNPMIVQPLGWLEDPSLTIRYFKEDSMEPSYAPVSITIHPGIGLHAPTQESPEFSLFRRKLSHSSQRTSDAYPNNAGIIPLLNTDNSATDVVLLLDADNRNNHSYASLEQRRNGFMEELKDKFDNKADYISAVLQATFPQPEIMPWLRAFQTHQPLRHMFWDAFKDPANPDIQKRDKFWQTCARVTNNPHQAMMPVWRVTPGQSGKPVFMRTESFIPHVLMLYRPWTGRQEDIPAYAVDPAVKQTLLDAGRIQPVPEAPKMRWRLFDFLSKK